MKKFREIKWVCELVATIIFSRFFEGICVKSNKLQKDSVALIILSHDTTPEELAKNMLEYRLNHNIVEPDSSNFLSSIKAIIIFRLSF